MQIRQQTDSILVLEERDRLALFVSFILFAIAVFLIFLSSLSGTSNLEAKATGIAIGVLFGVAALLPLLSGTTRLIASLDKGTNRLSMTQESPLGKQMLGDFGLRDILEVALIPKVRSSPRGGSHLTFFLCFVLKNGAEIAFGTPSSQSFTFTLSSIPVFGTPPAPGSRLNEIGKQVAQFLGVPFTVRRPPSLQNRLQMFREDITEATRAHQRLQDRKD